MTYIYLDESGDLGFGRRSSRWFIFTLAMTSDKRALERVTKKVWKTLHRKYPNTGELHAYHADDITRRRMLQQLAEVEDLAIMSVVLNKEKVYVNLREQKHFLYNYVANILMDRLHKRGKVDGSDRIELYIDRKDTKRHLCDNLISYLERSMQDRRGGAFEVALHASHDNKSLQAVDFISWAMFRKYERNDYEWYEIIKSKIIDEKPLFP